jgi:aminoglycoside phosphotransferase (APT) family kinase protein
MNVDEMSALLRDWFVTQLGDADDVRVEGFDRVEFGHSAETILLTLAWSAGGDQHRRDVVLRVRPPEPGLLEPYDLEQQFKVLRALEPTSVRSPKVLWYEGTGGVLGRPFYVMERLAGTVYEQTVPDELISAPDRLRRMSQSLVEKLAAIHLVDVEAAGLGFLGDGSGFLPRELDWWTSEMRRVQRGPLPGLERLRHELQATIPEQCPTVTLVHGDAKPGNFAFDDDEVSAVFDWEMTSVGDPLTDLGWAEFNWTMPGSFTSHPGSLTPDEMVELYQQLTGITVQHRDWYVALELYKMLVIMLVAAMLFDTGASDDLRFAQMGQAIPPYTVAALTRIGVAERLEPGPVTARGQRVHEVTQRQAENAP